MADPAPVRIATLGAARITPMSLIRPARDVDGADIVAVAARDPERARAYATKHGIARVHASYDDLLADPDIDAIYNPLPNSLHAEWTIRALEAGKHVLCEKPLASNAAEAQRMADAAAKADRVLVEAFHWRHHPLTAQVRAIIDSGEIGQVTHVHTAMCIPLPMRKDIRYRFDLAGGATMDVGCYAINMLRFYAGQEPSRVTDTSYKLMSENVDRSMRATFDFPTGATGAITCSLLSWRLLNISARITGDAGEIRILNPVAPHMVAHRLKVTGKNGSRTDWGRGGDATYTYQLRAFVARLRGGPEVPTTALDGVANMQVVDAVYDHAGLARRGAQ